MEKCERSVLCECPADQEKWEAGLTAPARMIGSRRRWARY
jgi:hypothetical protein